jgi:8-oxo-dGTP diphosphatase
LSEPPALVYLIRHAKAGDPERWQGADRERPLTRSGRLQAEALSKELAKEPIQHVLSSPYRRCLETVAPLAQRLGVPVEPSSALAVGAGVAGVLNLLTTAAPGTALCSHGDVIPELLYCLVDQGLLHASAVRCAKGSTWVLERVADRLVGARYISAPHVA